MTDIPSDVQQPPAIRWFLVAAVSAILIAAAVALLYGPAVSLALTGDSYQWIQHAHLAAHRPALLLADLDTFYRPSTTWTLVADRAVWGGFSPGGYRTTSLILHGTVALCLVVAGRRLGLGWSAATLVGLVWTTSSFTDESAFIVAYRFQPLLLISWLVLIAAWPRAGEPWSGRRIAVVAIAIGSAAAAKETWVVTPALVAALEIDRRQSWRAAAVPTVAVGCAVAAYLAFYFAAFPSSKSYFEIGPHILAKIPAQLAAFLFLEKPVLHEISMTWINLFATVVFSAMAISCLRWRAPGTLVAVCLFVLPTLPTLFVPYMPLRYLAIPYAGFLLLTAIWIGSLIRRISKGRIVVPGVAIATASLVVVAGTATVRADLEYHRLVAAAHVVLLKEAAVVLGPVAGDKPVAVIRNEHRTPLLDLVESSTGSPTLAFVRNHDPYGLIDTAALFEWVLAEERTHVQNVDDWETECNGTEGVVLVHRNGGFDHLGVTPDLAEETERWRSSGRGVQVIRMVGDPPPR